MNHHAQFDRERQLFEQALELPEGAERLRFIKEACGADTALLVRLQDLLRAHADQGFIPGKPTAAQPTVMVPGLEGPGTVIGRYKLLQELGEGGCGTVYMAQQEEPVRRRVALKLIKPGMDSKNVIARFEAERQALALMEHPNIAQVFDAGATEHGRPFFVMELVRGVPITDYCDAHGLAMADRLRLFVQVCRAVQHAHQKGIIHRDLKPSNILVTENDGAPVPKVIDFGIAKATNGQALTNKTVFTAFEQFVGTPAYMSPEQTALTSLDIDTRTDIYSLGVLLYELLTGRPPFDPKELVQAGFDEMRRTIRETEPARPSMMLAALLAEELTKTAKRRHIDPPRLIHLIRGDLDWIVMKCLEKDRARRYETANGLAAEIGRYLNNEPVTARPPSKLYRFQKTARRNKLTFAATGAVALALVLGVVVSYRQARIADEARKAADVAKGNSQTEAQRAEDEAQRAKKAAAETQLALSASAFLQAVQLIEEGKGSDALAYLVRSLSANPTNSAAATRLATLLMYHTWMQPTLVRSNEHGVDWAKFSPDGKRIVTASWDGIARVWDARSGQPLTPPLKHEAAVWAAFFSPDGERVLTLSKDRTSRLWDAHTGRPLSEPLKQDGPIHDLGWLRQPVRPELERYRRPDGYQVMTKDCFFDRNLAAQFSPDGRCFITAGHDNTARVWDTQTGMLRWTLTHGNLVATAQFSSNGSRIVTASADGSARVWDTQTGRLLTKGLKHMHAVLSAQFSPDGTRVVTTSQDGTACLWNAETGAPMGQPMAPQDARVNDGRVMSAEFSPDGKRVVTASVASVCVWDAFTGQPVMEPLWHGGTVVVARFSKDGSIILTGSADNTVRLWDATNGQPLTEPLKHPGPVQCAEISPDGRQILTASTDARIWEAWGGRPLQLFWKHSAQVMSAHFSANGQQITSSDLAGQVVVWDARNGRRVLSPSSAAASQAANLSPDGKYILTGTWDKPAQVCDAVTGAPVGKPLRHKGDVYSAVFSPDSTRVVTASWDRTARVWDALTGDPLTEPLQHGDQVFSAVFSPDGKRVLTASYDNTARLWDARTGRLLTAPLRHGAGLRSARFSPDGRRIVTASEDRTGRVWDTETGQPLTDPLPHYDWVRMAEFSPDGRRIVTTSGNGDKRARVWDIAPTGSSCPNWVLHLAEAIAGQTVNEAGVFEETKLNRMETIHQIRELVNRQSPTDDWVEWGRWLLADPATRTISPFCEPTLAKYIEARLEDLDTASLDAAARAAGQSETLLKLIADTRAALEWTGKAQVLEQEGNLTEAVDAWSQALALSGEGRHQLGTWYLTRGRLHARLERWSEAADDLMQARRLNPQDIWPWQQLAPLLIKTGEVEEYRQHREAMLANFGATGGPGVDGKTVKVFTLLPAPAGPSLTSVAKIASRAVAQGQASPHLAYIQATKGVADYREGHFAQAAEWSEKALANRRKGNSALEAQILNAQAYPVLAMARYQLNQTEPAREALRKAKEIAEQNLSKRISDPGFPWNDLLVAEIFLNEAKALIEGQESAAAR